MSLALLLIIWLISPIGLTIALVLVVKSRNKYKDRADELEKQLRIANGEPVQQGPGQAPASAPVPVAAPVQVNAPVTASAPVAAPAPVPVKTAAPAPAPAKYEYTASKERPKKSSGTAAVSVSFAVGVLLIVIAAAVFISATWQTLPAGIKCIVLFLAVASVYGLSLFSGKKLKLTKTSSVLYMLGSLVTPLAVFVGSLAFEVDETLLTLVCCALCLGVTGFIGYRIFGSKLQVAISYLGFVWSELFIMMELLGNLTGFAFGICFAALVSGLIHYINPKIRFFGLFAEVTAYTAVTGMFMCFGIEAVDMWWSIGALLMYWVSLLLLDKRRRFIRYISPFVPLILLIVCRTGSYTQNRDIFAAASIAFIAGMFAVYRFTSQESPVSNAVASAGSAVFLFFVSRNFQDLDLDLRDFLFYVWLIVPVLSFVTVIIMSRHKIERAIYWYPLALSIMIMCSNIWNVTVASYILFVLAAAALVICFRTGKLHPVTATAASSLIMFLMSIADNIENASATTVIIIFASFAAMYYGAAVLLNKYTKVSKSTFYAGRFSSLALLAVSNITLLVSAINDKPGSFIALILIDVVITALTMFDTDNYFGLLPAATFAVLIGERLISNDVDTMAVGALIMVFYVILGRLLICERLFTKNRVDWLTVIGGAACFICADEIYKTTLLFTVFVLSFAGRLAGDGATGKAKFTAHLRTILTVAVISLAVSLATLDVDYISGIDFEIRLAFLIAAALIILLVIKPGPSGKWIWFTAVAACLEMEAWHAIGEGFLIPLSVVTVCAVGIFIYSFAARRKSWFILAIALIGQIGLVFAITFWESKLWWIYLLVLGGILIATASVNEYRRRIAAQKGEKNRLFKDWVW